jgi:IS5 family transposase
MRVGKSQQRHTPNLLSPTKMRRLKNSSMLDDRISFRRFVGLKMEQPAPDETTFVQFRRRLNAHGHIAMLFEKTIAILKFRGVILEEGTCVDATIIEAPRGRTAKDGISSTKDKAASYTKKHGCVSHGYKGHISTARNGMIKAYCYDTASTHDSKHIDEFIENEKHSVWADSAYMDKKRKAALIGALASLLALTSARAAEKMKMTTDIPVAITTPDSVETRLGTLKFLDGFPDDATVEKVYDTLDFSRGVQARV